MVQTKKTSVHAGFQASETIEWAQLLSVTAVRRNQAATACYL